MSFKNLEAERLSARAVPSLIAILFNINSCPSLTSATIKTSFPCRLVTKLSDEHRHEMKRSLKIGS